MRACWAQQGGVMGSPESRIGRGASACGDQCVDHAVSALLTCKAVLKAVGRPRGSLCRDPEREKKKRRRNSAVFICNSAQDEAKERAHSDRVYWTRSSAKKRRKRGSRPRCSTVWFTGHRPIQFPSNLRNLLKLTVKVAFESGRSARFRLELCFLGAAASLAV